MALDAEVFKNEWIIDNGVDPNALLAAEALMPSPLREGGPLWETGPEGPSLREGGPLWETGPEEPPLREEGPLWGTGPVGISTPTGDIAALVTIPSPEQPHGEKVYMDIPGLVDDQRYFY